MSQDYSIPTYWESPYTKEFTTKITHVDKNNLQFDKTIFYPGGGGQLSDTGNISYLGSDFPVIQAFKDDSGIWHEVKNHNNTEFKIGDEVTLKLDWNRRYSFMRAHSSQHLLTNVLITMFECETTKANFNEGFVEIEVNKKLKVSKIIQAFKEVNKIINHGDDVLSVIVDQATFAKEYKSKTRGKDPKEDIVRLIQLGEEAYDIVGCGGIHVQNLSEIKGIILESVKGNLIKYYVDEQAFDFANKQRELMIELEEITEKKGEKLTEMVSNKIKDAESLLHGNVSLLKMIFTQIGIWSENVEGKSITLLELPEIDRQIIQSSAKELENDSFLALLGRNDILYILSSKEDLPADEIVKRFSVETGAKGGGSKTFSQVSTKNIDNPLSILKEVIKEF